MLVLHGWGGSVETVDPVVSMLAPAARAYAIDLPGFGESDPPPVPWGTSDYASFVRDFMDALGIESAAIVGHSFGGRIAIRLGIDVPDRVKKLVLVNSAGIRPRRSARYYRRLGLARLGNALERVGGRPGALVRAATARLTMSQNHFDGRPLLRTFARVVSEDLRDELPRLTVPTLLVWGAKDHQTPLADGMLMERLIPDARLVVFEHAGHFSHRDEAPGFREVVTEFLSGADGAGP